MRLSAVFLLSAGACGATPPVATPPPAAAPPIAAAAVPSAPTPIASALPAAPPKKRLTIPEARRFMLTLINQDRASEHLPPVELDEGPPTTAGQAHADDMAKNGYLGHWGTDGSVPEQRHSEAGGSDMVLENALCFTDLATRTLDGHPLIDAEQVVKAESMFFHEVPPNDGHRKNILKTTPKNNLLCIKLLFLLISISQQSAILGCGFIF